MKKRTFFPILILVVFIVACNQDMRQKNIEDTDTLSYKKQFLYSEMNRMIKQYDPDSMQGWWKYDITQDKTVDSLLPLMTMDSIKAKLQRFEEQFRDVKTRMDQEEEMYGEHSKFCDSIRKEGLKFLAYPEKEYEFVKKHPACFGTITHERLKKELGITDNE